MRVFERYANIKTGMRLFIRPGDSHYLAIGYDTHIVNIDYPKFLDELTNKNEPYDIFTEMFDEDIIEYYKILDTL